MTARTDEIAAEREAYRTYFNAGVSALMSRMWGGNLHMGMFADAEETLAAAQLRLKENIARALGLPPGGRVIEVACGVGTTAIHLSGRAGLRVHATNISDDQLAEARSRAKVAGVSDRVSFAVADYHSLPDPDRSYDAWLCQEALLYARDRGQVFAEARRVLRPGGRLLFTDLTLSHDMPPGDRESLMRDIRAPFLWPPEAYARLVSETGLICRERQESTANAERTFAAVGRNLAALEGEFRPRLGGQAFREAQMRIQRQHDAARTGHLGWCLYCLEVPLAENGERDDI
jgi:sarcosine/dimethylglycine N-methyltransferase